MILSPLEIGPERIADFNAPSPAVAPEYRARWWDLSTTIRAQPDAVLDLRYGDRPRARLDYFPCGASDAPLFVFVHGGYWQRMEKERFSFVSTGPRHHGINVCLVGYTLAPEARLSDIVAEIRQCLTFLQEQSETLGFDRNKVFLGGWSAGGHLTVANLAHPLVRGGIAISGLYNLAPIALSTLNEKLALDEGDVAALSPLNNLPQRSVPLHLFVGGDEKVELRRQSSDYAAAAQARGLPVSLTTLPGHHHFSILDEFAPSGALTRGLLTLIRSTCEQDFRS